MPPPKVGSSALPSEPSFTGSGRPRGMNSSSFSGSRGSAFALSPREQIPFHFRTILGNNGSRDRTGRTIYRDRKGQTDVAFQPPDPFAHCAQSAAPSLDDAGTGALSREK